MKAKHLLAALVLPAVFSACSQDELVTNSVDKEVVGTPIGYLEFTASRSGATTRLAPGIGWEENDKIGMGWISGGADLPASGKLFSNHPLYYLGGNGSFKSETIIYEGLYIASFPFQTTQKISSLEFDLAEQKSEDSYYSKRWNVSDKFIDLDVNNAGLGKETPITLVPLTNLMKLNIKLPASSSVPADLKITGVTLVDANNKLINKLALESNNAAVTKGQPALATACWTGATGNIEVQVGEDEVGAAIDATKGLDVYVQMGAFDAADATTLTIHTNYGDASITTGTGSVSWSSKALNQEEPAKVNDFALAVQAMNAVATGKEYGQNVAVNVTLDPASIEVPTKVTNQEDLDKIIATLESLGQLDKAAKIEFAKSDLKKADGVVDADGDVILTDLSGLNRIGGAITFQKATGGQDPANVYISGELALQAVPAASVDFTVLNGNTLTVSEDLDLGANGIIVNAGATLVNKAKITASTVTTTAGVAATDDAPAIPAGLYISEVGADASGITTFINGGAIEWKAGKLHSTMNNGVLYANVTTIQDMVNADEAFEGVTANCEIIIANDFAVAPLPFKAELANIKKMTIKGNVTFGLGRKDAYEFSALTNIDVQSGSFNLTGGDQGTDADAFYVFKAADAGCRVSLAFGTELNIPAGAKLDLGTNGIVSYTNAIVTNNGFVAGQSLTGTGTWNGNAIGVNPKSQD